MLCSLESYGGEKIPVERINYRPAYMNSEFGKKYSSGFDGTSSYESCITDVLDAAFNGEGTQQPIAYLEQVYGFRGVSEIEACQFATVLAEYIAIYGSNDDNSGTDYGSPGGYAGETIDTMEDLFLLSVFEMYTCLVLKEVK